MADDSDTAGRPAGTMASTGPGIPDDALGPGEELLEPPSDEAIERAAEALGAPAGSKEALPLEGQ